MTYNWYDQRASTWYEGYAKGDTGQGSFVDLSTLTKGTADYNKALDAVTNNILGLFEQKGITAEQAKASDDYKALIDQAKDGDTEGAFKGAAAAVTSAADRGDLWGASEAEGGDAMRGKSFFDNVSDTTTIQDLYTQGFGDTVGEIDAEGLKYWEDRLAGTSADGIQMSIQEIAASFAASDEAQLRDAYHEQYGRDEDTNEHIDYWLNNAEAGQAKANFLNAVTYRGEDQDGDGIVSQEERLTSKYSVQGETMVRDDLRNIMGQVSREEDRAKTPFFTAANNADVQRYMDHIGKDAIDPTTGERIAGVGNKSDNYDNALFTNTHIGYRGLTMDSLNQGDADDFRGVDLDGNGVVEGDEITNNPTMMGRFGTKAEVKEYMDQHSGVDSDDLSAAQASGTFQRDFASTNAYAQKVFDSVHPKVWGAVTREDDTKKYVPWQNPFDGTVTKTELEALLHEKNLPEWKEKSSLWKSNLPGGGPVGGGTGGGGTGQDGWRPDIPDKPTKPTPLPVDKPDIDYMPNVSSDVQDTSGYGAAKTQFDQAVKAAAPDIRTAQGQAGQRFTGTSAKGVRMKRSKASRMGTIRGTKQLGREQQLKSLNI